MESTQDRNALETMELSKCVQEIGRLRDCCMQLRKSLGFTFEEVYKMQQETQRVVGWLKRYIAGLDIDTFVFVNTLDEIKNMFLEANFAGAMLENYLQNIFGQILTIEYTSACSQLEECRNSNKKMEKEKETVTLSRVYRNYKESQDENMRRLLGRAIVQGYLDTYNYEYTAKYASMNIEDFEDLYFDDSCGMHYVNHKGKRLYYPQEYNRERTFISYRYALSEQDLESPHCYMDDNFSVKEGDVVIDAGVAEGNFSIEIVDKVSKLYLVECDQKWIPALKKTFEPYGDKVEIVEKFLGVVDDEECITIDTLVGNQSVNFIKMDVEGAEMDVLHGAHQTLQNSQDIKLAVCSYHKKGDEERIKNLLEEYGMETSTTQGYMFYRCDLDSWIDGELRRGIVRGMK